MVKTDLEFKVGRRSTDGTVKLSSLSRQVIQLSVSYKGERASSVVLTRSQVQALRQALGEYELSLTADEEQSDGWNHKERRVVG